MQDLQTKAMVQYFKPYALTLPYLIYKGPVLNFANYEGIEVDGSSLVFDADNNLIPDGFDTLGLYITKTQQLHSLGQVQIKLMT